MDTRVAAPELPAGLEWVNVSEPPRLAALRGRVVLLYFWTYDGVNCWNLLPELNFLENKYHDGLTVIGIHTPKYPHQHGAAPVLKAVNRHELRHAVASDPGFILWQQYGIEGWPTVAVIDPQGLLVDLFAGEGRRNELDALIGQLLDHAAAQDQRVFEPALPAARPEPRHPLAFPGKLLATADALYVADSGHHRVLECSHDGRILRQFGSGNPAWLDGAASDAGFRDPQGLALHRDALYVADRGNYAIRRIRLASGEVETVLGTGAPGRTRPDGTDPRAAALSAPTDIAVAGDRIFVAVAGQHQIWQLDADRARVSVLAGSGRLGIADETGREAEFGQPSGLAVVGQSLAVADAATSAIRLVRLADARVSTVVGVGPYEFGDAAGMRDKARLQNPLAVAVDPRGLVFIADSYNGRIKVLSAKTGEVRALNLAYRFQEPGGLSVAAGALWVANTNAHEIVRIDLAGGTVRRVPVGE